MVAMLTGGSRQSIGGADAVARIVRAEPDRAAELWEAVAFPDPLVHMRAVDALEKVSATRPDVLRGHEREVLEVLPVSAHAAVRWHVGLLIPRLELDERLLATATDVLERLLRDPSRIVQANALSGIVRLADHHPDLGDLAAAALDSASRSPYPSVRAQARARRLGH